MFDTNLFYRSTTVNLKASDKHIAITYTIDGSEPTFDSPIMKSPLKIESNLTLKARSFYPNGMGSRTVTAQFKAATPVTSQLKVNANKMKKGMNYLLYTGNILSITNDWKYLKLKNKGFSDSIVIPVTAPKDSFALEFNGYLKIDSTDIYTFYLTSDDGSTLSINGKPLINNDGVHGKKEVAAQIALEKGFHVLQLRYFDAKMGEYLKVEWESDFFSKKSIDAIYRLSK